MQQREEKGKKIYISEEMLKAAYWKEKRLGSLTEGKNKIKNIKSHPVFSCISGYHKYSK